MSEPFTMPFNESMDETLLANGFGYYDDWEFGPCSGWSIFAEHFTLKLMRHSFGYWLILDAHASGDRKRLNIGSANNAEDILAVRNALEKLW